MGKTLGDMTPDERREVIQRAAGQFQSELTAAAPAIAQELEQAGRIQQLQELTDTQHEDVGILLATYRNQYTRGWNKSRVGRRITSDASSAELEGYEDHEFGLPKWAQMAVHGFLDTELAR